MALLSRIYFNAVFGALGGLLGWVLFGVLGEKNPCAARRYFCGFRTRCQHAFWAARVIGGADRLFRRQCRGHPRSCAASLRPAGVLWRAARGSSAAPGHVSAAIKSIILLIRVLGASLAVTMLARGLGWCLLGVAIGMSEGIAARSLGKFSYGTLGGALGGFLGGVLFELFHSFARASLSTTYFWSALGLVILGACIGSLSALVQSVFSRPTCGCCAAGRKAANIRWKSPRRCSAAPNMPTSPCSAT